MTKSRGKKTKTILFDLDGTLLPMDQEKFTKRYFELLAEKMSAYGYDKKQLVTSVWEGTAAMVRNDGTKSNEKAFWHKFAEIYGKEALADQPLFDAFYEREFQGARAFCGFDLIAVETVKKIKKMGLRLILATNPIFPKTATEFRIHWAGLEPSDFEFIAAYENSRYCKPNPKYYNEILSKLNLQPEECLMVGNDVTEDMVARKIGMNVFLLTDCLINKEREDINQYPRGSFEQLLNYIEKAIKGESQNE